MSRLELMDESTSSIETSSSSPEEIQAQEERKRRLEAAVSRQILTPAPVEQAGLTPQEAAERLEELTRAHEEVAQAYRSQHNNEVADPQALAQHEHVDQVVPTTFTHPAVERALFTRESSFLGSFEGADRYNIGQQINRLVENGTITDDQAFQLEQTAFQRIAMQNAIVSRRKAVNADKAGNREEYVKEMQAWQQVANGFDATQISRTPGVAEGRNWIVTNCPEYFRSDDGLMDWIRARRGRPPKPKYDLKGYLAGITTASGKLTPMQVEIAVKLSENVLFLEKVDPSKDIQRTNVVAEQLGAKKLNRVYDYGQAPKVEAAKAASKGIGNIAKSFSDNTFR
jgi:hypothetical protein